MIQYSVLSRSGKMNVLFTPYEQALEIFNSLKGQWDDRNCILEKRHVSFCCKNGDKVDTGYLTDDQFLNDCVPKKAWRVGYKDLESYTTRLYEEVQEEKQNAIYYGDIENFTLEEIMISDLELALLPEFQGF